jgi:hypothetical protein
VHESVLLTRLSLLSCSDAPRTAGGDILSIANTRHANVVPLRSFKADFEALVVSCVAQVTLQPSGGSGDALETDFPHPSEIARLS